MWWCLNRKYLWNLWNSCLLLYLPLLSDVVILTMILSANPLHVGAGVSNGFSPGSIWNHSLELRLTFPTLPSNSGQYSGTTCPQHQTNWTEALLWVPYVHMLDKFCKTFAHILCTLCALFGAFLFTFAYCLVWWWGTCTIAVPEDYFLQIFSLNTIFKFYIGFLGISDRKLIGKAYIWFFFKL